MLTPSRRKRVTSPHKAGFGVVLDVVGKVERLLVDEQLLELKGHIAALKK
jgi:hypothetical protein